MKVKRRIPSGLNDTRQSMGNEELPASDIDRYVEQLQEQILVQAREQYSDTVVEHWMHPRNQCAMERPDGHGKIKGPCGDTMELFIKVEDRRIANASFLTDGCITSIASGSMAVEIVDGKPLLDAASITQEEILNKLGGLPNESKHCALLASITLRAAVDDYICSSREPWRRLYGLSQ